MSRALTCFAAGLVLLLMGEGSALAAGGAAAPEAAPNLKAKAGSADEKAEPEPATKPKDRGSRKWIRRWRPERNMGTFGVYAGMFFANPDHDLYDPVTQPQEPLWAIAPDIGLRGGFFPLRSLGVEAEFSAVPHRVRSITNDPVFVYGFRAHAVVQLPYYSVVPFFLIGYGALGVVSPTILLGRDLDPAFHYGGGVKVFFHRYIGARFEVRNIISAAEARQDSGTSHVQALLGLEFTFGRRKPPDHGPPPAPEDKDRDNDGILNHNDECPDTAGVQPHGCPDTDGDGIDDRTDACPEVPGAPPDGCPVKDTDGDGIIDRKDDCPFQPENFNNFEDQDGCPDEVPEELKIFTGALKGIEFDFNKATIRATSTPTLDKAVATLKKYPDTRVKITGHTDDVGGPEFNLELSKRRAAAVKKYLVDKGVKPKSVETAGKGMTEPLVPNDSDENRAKNRRIEFQILSKPSKKRPEAAKDK